METYKTKTTGVKKKTVRILDVRFAQSNKFIKHVNLHTKRLCFSVVVYLIVSVSIVYLFKLLYNVSNLKVSFWDSAKVYFGVAYSEPIVEKDILVLLEIISRDLFSILVVGVTISNLLVPQNPIEISEIGIYRHQRIQFRYWIMLPPHEFLYDACIRIALVRKSELDRDDGKLVRFPEDEETEELRLIRGVRTVTLTPKFSTAIINKLHNGRAYKVFVIITGNLNNGRRYYAYKTYETETILCGYRYVPVEREKIKERASIQNMYNLRKIPEINYLNFNLTYQRTSKNGAYFVFCDNNRRIQETGNRCKLEENCYDYLDKCQFSGRKGCMNRLLNYFAFIYLNSSHPLSSILRIFI